MSAAAIGNFGTMRTLMLWLILTAVFSCEGLSAAAHVGQAVSDRVESEDEIRFHTPDVLPATILTGPNYQIDPVATLQHGRMIFVLHTPWGDLPAAGRPMLDLRVQEMHAIDRAIRSSRDPHLLNSFLGNIRQSREGAELILRDPLGSVMRVPMAVNATLNDVVNPVNRRSGGEMRRKVAAELDCDPETTNPVLSALLDWIAARQGVGSMAGKAGLSLMVPGLGLIPASAQFREQLASKQPSQINAELEQQLLAAGYPPETSRMFCRNSGYTTLQRLQITESLLTLNDVPQKDILLLRLVRARESVDGMTAWQEIREVAALHAASPVQAVVDGDYLTVVQSGHRCRLICTDDYLVQTDSLARFATAHAARFGSQPVVLHGHTALSGQARRTLAAAEITLASETAASN